MWIGTVISALLQKACMIIRINGVQSEQVPIWRALVGNIPMIGMLRIWNVPARLSQDRLCQDMHFYRKPVLKLIIYL